MKDEFWKHLKGGVSPELPKPTYEECKRVQLLQERLYKERTVPVGEFMNALNRINREHLEEVVLERAAQGWCGLAICGDVVSRQKSRISGGEIYSDKLVGCFCGTKCYKLYYKCKDSISIVPFHQRSSERKEQSEVIVVREVRPPVLKEPVLKEPVLKKK